MPHKAENQLGRKAQLLLGALAPRHETLHDRLVGNAAVLVHLRIEKDFGMVDAVGMRLLEIRPGEIGEVGLVMQDGHADEVEVEEVIEAGEVAVAGGEGIDGGVFGGLGQLDVVSGGQVENEARGEAAFQVDVVFTFGEALEEGVPLGLRGIGFAHFVDDSLM